MKKNMGTADRVIRILLAVVFIFVYVLKAVTGTWGLVLLVAGIIFLITSFVSFCPLYAVFRINTTRQKQL